MIKKMIMLYFAALAVMGAGAAMEDVSSLTIVLHKNDGTGMTRELMVRHNTSITLPGAVKTLKWAPRRGFSFMGWAISEKSKNIFLKDQSKVTTAISSKDTLHVYAIWQLKAASSYAIQYIRNDGSGSVRTIGFNGGETAKLNSVKALGFERRGYAFVGWATSTEDARNKKVWKKDMGLVSQPVTNGNLLKLYAIWKMKSGYYSIRFNKNDDSGKWRELGYEYGANTTLPTIENGLNWARDDYKFGGWATSAANAAKGIAWRGDKGVTRTPVAAGKTLNVYAIWKNYTDANDYFEDEYFGYDGNATADGRLNFSVGITNLDDFLPSLKLNSSTAKLAVSGLPAGLKYDAANGKITGVATKAGTYTVTLTVTDGKAKYVSTITIEVEALPDWVVGTFEGYFEEYGWYDEWRQRYPESDLPSGCDWEAFGRFTVTISKEGKVSGKFIKAHETQAFTAELIEVKEGKYVFSLSDYKVKDGNGWNEYGNLLFSINYGEYEGASCGQIEGLLTGWEGDNHPSPFYREIFAKQNVWSVKGVSLPKIVKTEKYHQRYNDHIYNIEGELTLDFSTGRNAVTASFLFDDEDDRKYLKITKCTSQFLIQEYDKVRGVFLVLLPVYMNHLDDLPWDDDYDEEWIDLDFLIPIEIDIKGNVNIHWDDVKYAHDDWW